MTVEFECITRLSSPVQRSFDLARSIDLHVSSMAASRERAVAGTTTGLIGDGEEVTWRAWHFGVPFRLTSRITEFDEPASFVDEQVRGPFRSFRHEHGFAPDGSGGTIMTDRVRFVAPFGPLGRIAEVVIGPYLQRLIEQRNAHIAASAH
ncbi:ligand-binding SRPBCC domain-containing protein [Agromyces cerinus]|uniref:SRPBCC family protein n=1 Tax=Agromyces cerinus TaxID=33878 RepID=UPI00195C3D07|nr:SRPBCC family protein [Agromyces cerinus]MBM7830438.1 ligand-binding SRPBCC domain-containing protein [Agromyces cerinus]